MKSYTLTAILLLATASSFVLVETTVLASTSMSFGQDRGGGDARVIRSKILDSKMPILIREVTGVFKDPNPNSNATTSVRGLLSWISRGRLKLGDIDAQKKLDDMLDKGFGKDLSQTKFVLSKKCLDKEGIEKSASTEMNVPRADICVNPERIAREFGPYIQDSDLMGLMMHEFAHHYGYSDIDHSFAASIASAYQADNEYRNQEGDPLNYLINTNSY